MNGIIKNLKEQNNLLGSGSLMHSYPHSWRSKAPLVHRATPQWFISMESHKLRKKAIDSIDKTTFYPEKGKTRIRSMIETRPDWCISRQRSWGVPLPIFIDKKTNEPLRDPEVIENIAKIINPDGDIVIDRENGEASVNVPGVDLTCILGKRSHKFMLLLRELEKRQVKTWKKALKEWRSRSSINNYS